MKGPKRWLTAAGTLGMICFAASAAMAQHPGQLVNLTSSGTNVRDLFVFTNGGKTIEVTGEAPGSPSGTSDWFIGGVRLVGFRSLYLVDISGVNPAPAPVALGSAFVKTSVASLTQTNWVTKTDNGYNYFDNNGPGFGFKDGTHYLVVSNNAGLAAANKSTSTNTDRFGSFTFGSSLIGGNGLPKYGIGLDYILANGNTGRAYFKYTPLNVPEPAFYQLASLLGLGSFGMLRMRRKSKNA